MLENFISFFNSEDFMPHGHCFLWMPQILWLHVVSDALIALAYYSIPISLMYFVRSRTDMPFRNLFYLFGTFILLCGTTHIMSIWVIWHPDYAVDGVIKALTAFVSVLTAIISWKIIPQALELKSPAELEKLNTELHHAYEEIEDKVEARTAELTEVNERLQKSQHELQQALAAAQEASTAKTDFLANMSHEIRTPMNAIVGLADLLSNDKASPEKQKEFIHTMQISAQALMNLLNDLLDITKLESETVRLEQISFNISELAEEIISIMSVPAREKGIRLFIKYDAALNNNFVGDPLRLRQILTNLISNAVKFTERGTVTVQLDALPDAQNGLVHVTIDVIDTGIGIPTAKLETIFDKFSQADTSITRKFGGTGLGLSICKTLVTLMGGKISVVSTVGLGSKFSAEIPMLPANKSVIHKNQHLKENGVVLEQIEGKDQPTILLVEDYPANVLVATSIIESCGYRWEHAEDGRKALEKFRLRPYDLILMDVQLPDMDGITATKAIREMEIQSQMTATPVLGITAYSLNGDREKCLASGMDDYLSKPYNAEELKEKMRKLLKKHLN